MGKQPWRKNKKREKRARRRTVTSSCVVSGQCFLPSLIMIPWAYELGHTCVHLYRLIPKQNGVDHSNLWSRLQRHFDFLFSCFFFFFTFNRCNKKICFPTFFSIVRMRNGVVVSTDDISKKGPWEFTFRKVTDSRTSLPLSVPVVARPQSPSGPKFWNNYHKHPWEKFESPEKMSERASRFVNKPAAAAALFSYFFLTCPFTLFFSRRWNL